MTASVLTTELSKHVSDTVLTRDEHYRLYRCGIGALCRSLFVTGVVVPCPPPHTGFQRLLFPYNLVYSGLRFPAISESERGPKDNKYDSLTISIEPNLLKPTETSKS